MDLSYITKFANLKRTCSEAEQLRDKINKENKKTIQWRVEHQASFHQLSEKYKQLESNYECLQQNMLHAQMEREKMSEAYLHEKQQRHELLNKVSSTREICEALTKYETGLKETLNRCRSDLGALCDAYNNATDVVKNIKRQYKQATEKMQTDITNLEEKLKLLNENRSQLEQFCESNKQEAALRIANAEQQFAEERRRVYELGALLQKETLEGHTLKHKIQQLENETAVVKNELQLQHDRMKQVAADMDDDLRKQIQANELMKQDIVTQEESRKILREEIQKLQDALAAAENNIQRFTVENQQLNEAIIKYEQALENLQKESAVTENKYKELFIEKETELKDKIETIEDLTNIMSALKIDKDSKEAENVKIQEEYNTLKNVQLQTEADLVTSKDEITKLKEELESYNKNINDMVSEWKNMKDESYKLNEIIEVQEVKIKEENAKFEELQTLFNEKIQESADIIKEKENLAAVNKNLILEHNNERDYLKNRIAELEKLVEEKKMELVSMKSVPDMNAPQNDNAVLTPVTHTPTPIRNEMFFAMPTATDVYNYNFSDSSQGSIHINDFSGLFPKHSQVKPQVVTYKRKKSPLDVPARDTDGDKIVPRQKVYKTKNIYQRKAN